MPQMIRQINSLAGSVSYKLKPTRDVFQKSWWCRSFLLVSFPHLVVVSHLADVLLQLSAAVLHRSVVLSQLAAVVSQLADAVSQLADAVSQLVDAVLHIAERALRQIAVELHIVVVLQS